MIDEQRRGESMPYHIEAVAKRLMFSPSELKEILEVFFSESGELLAQYPHAIARQDYTEAARIFHSIKGSAATLGLDDLANMALNLEMKAKSQQLDEVQEELPEIQKTLQELEAAFIQYFQNQ